jgi:hypothetical protein
VIRTCFSFSPIVTLGCAKFQLFKEFPSPTINLVGLSHTDPRSLAYGQGIG